MPLVEVEIIGCEPSVPAQVARPLADALAHIFGSGPTQTWVRVRSLARDAYAENGVAKPLGVSAVFVTITKRALPDAVLLATEAALVSTAVGEIVARPPERVHVIYEPPGAGRIAFGGELVT
jgi:phenylpyruvate tautomerase PptA (4-oxalocrotonate tautomerase family)